MTAKKPILCLDFDGCIHDYSQGWRDGSIYGDVVPGFFDWAAKAAEIFTLVIHSSRCATKEGRAEIREWLERQAGVTGNIGLDDEILIQEHKPPAFMTIDDRALRFTGDWASLDPKLLIKFRPWNHPEHGK
jgi:hypothetical protein